MCLTPAAAPCPLWDAAVWVRPRTVTGYLEAGAIVPTLAGTPPNAPGMDFSESVWCLGLCLLIQQTHLLLPGLHAVGRGYSPA